MAPDAPKKTFARARTFRLVSSVLQQKKSETFRDSFTLGRKLGAGEFGITYECVEKSSGQSYAVKVMPKVKLVTEQDVEDLRNEVAIMHHLAGQPHIVDIQGAYEDKESIYIVMELCTGGELYDVILDRMEVNGVPYSEMDAVEVMKAVVSVILECHSLGVVHRDLKPENFLVTSKGSDAALKVIDFGLSAFFHPEEGLTRYCGSPVYMAPEVIRCKRLRSGGALGEAMGYGPEVDIWSAGVILYILLCGIPPFHHRSNEPAEIQKAVLRGKLSFDASPWPQISAEAKSLITSMLDPDPKNRPTAAEVLQHPWFTLPGTTTIEPLPPVVAERLRAFSSMVKLKKLAVQIVASGLHEEEIIGLRELFRMMDTDNSGTITIEELGVGLKKLGAHPTEAELKQIMAEADIDNSGVLEYGEFIAATVHLSKIERQENLLKAFKYFDSDDSGYISFEELQQACKDLKVDEKEIEQMMEEVDTNHDGRIDYSEFVVMMRSKDGGANRRDVIEGLYSH
eukprot:TRINITY_DN6091_c0_g1_i1.p1 TRINITY_DN6091_c0_g1~~TRINITY_DN6091_c0_g1_i1.p1  ORF type:complete len:511 (-),score=134.74 TRINITY_DN6091_c0_g1_i1:229-1761(-)